MAFTVWLADFRRANPMVIPGSSPRNASCLPRGQAGGTAAILQSQRKIPGRLTSHSRAERKRNSGTSTIDRFRSLLETVLCFDLIQTGVVIVTYNSSSVIERCLDSCRDLRVVVVDNASQDNTRQLVERRGGVKLIRNRTNRGFASAVKQGVTELDTGLILALNPDVELETPIDALEGACRQDGVGLAGGRLVDQEGRVQTGFTLRRFPTPLTLVFEVLC